MINEVNREEYIEYLQSKAVENKRKTPLILAILGLLFGVFMGGGIIFSLMALASYLRNKKLGGTSLKWALVLGIIGLVLNVAFIVSIELIFILAQIPMPL